MNKTLQAFLIAGLFSLPTHHVYSAKRPAIKSVSHNVKKQRHKIRKIKNEILNLEKGLTRYNKRYIKNVNKTAKVEDRLSNVKGALNKANKKIVEHKALLKKIVFSAISNGVDDNQDYVNLIDQKYLKELSKMNIEKLRKLEHRVRYLTIDAKNLQKRLDEYRQTERDLYSILMDMETQKKDLAGKYIVAKEKQRELKSKLSKLGDLKKLKKKKKKSAKKIAKKTAIEMRAPIMDFDGITHKKKGVTFKFKNPGPVLATASGKVVYTGTLANYGNLIMINHGGNIRSVLLGNFSPKLKKGAYVKKGDIVGYTESAGKDSSIYFEVRKKNVAQNTIEWMDKSTYIK